MKPLSPLRFIKENKARCILLMFMLFLGYAAYLGGIYVSNPYDNWQLPIHYYEKLTHVYPSNDDEDGSKVFAFAEELENTGEVDVLRLGVGQSFNWNTIMAFASGSFSFTFLSVEDFKTYCEYMDIACDFDNLKDGSLIMSERFAKNRALKVGDTLGMDFSSGLYRDFRLDAVTGEDGYTLYFIDGKSGLSANLLILGKETGGTDLLEKYNVQVYDSIRTDVESSYRNFKRIYLFVIVLLALILAVTINAAFVGMYQQRNLEFAVYRAIGISKRRIIGKIVGELFCMDIIALTAGGAAFFFGLYLFNNLVLYPIGKYLRYFHPMALFGLLLCNLAVLVPLIVTRCRQMLKADICEY